MFPTLAAAEPETIQRTGELTFVDAINRVALIRPDRTDSQSKDVRDLPLYVELLPEAAVSYLGAPARLEDIPLGTHLHLTLQRDPDLDFTDSKTAAYVDPRHRAHESEYSLGLKVEDDFTRHRQQPWKIVEINPEAGTLTGQLPDAEPEVFDYSVATDVWIGAGLGEWTDVAVGQEVLFNLTDVSLFGPGRLTSIWLDPPARELATHLQAQRNAADFQLRGTPARIESVEHGEDGNGIVTATLISNTAPELHERLVVKKGVHILPAEPTLRTYQIGGTGGVLERSGKKGITFRMYELLEGIRPGRYVWLRPSGYTPDFFPREHSLQSFDIWPFPKRP